MIHTKELDKDTVKLLEELLNRDDLTDDEVATLAAREYYLTEEERKRIGIAEEVKPKLKRKFLK